MSKLDDILQKRLEDLERGQPINEILDNLPKQEKWLAPLIRLADQTRALPHPELSPEKVKIQQEKVIAEYIKGRKIREAQRGVRKSLDIGLSWLAAIRDSLSRPVLRTSLAVSMVVILAVIGLWIYNVGPVSAHSATLANINGVVEYYNQNSNTDIFAVAGDKIHQGQTIHTFAGSSATLEFFDGSQTTIGPDTTIALTKLDGTWNNALQVQILQTKGTTLHNVVPFKNNASYYLVNTPTGQASVHGTIFGVNVSENGQSIFTVDTGKVQVDGSGGQVFLTAGQATLVALNSSPQAPAFQFSLQGELTSKSGNQWTAAGVTFTVNDQTTYNLTPEVGDFVSVRGRILENNQWTADQVDLVEKNQEWANFTGQIVSMGSASWQVGGNTITVNSDTQIDTGLKIGDPVEVAFSVMPDGSWLAYNIEAQIGGIKRIIPTPTSTNTVKPTEGATETATEGATQTPQDTETATTSSALRTNRTINSQSQDDQTRGIYCASLDTMVQPEAQTLADRYTTASIPVTYSDIMGWFCQGYGFGEIDLAYSLSQEYSSTQDAALVESIFDMRASGMGWGQIQAQLKQEAGTNNQGIGKPPTNTPRPTNDNRPTKKSPSDNKP